MKIQWFPGHMAKAGKKLREQLKVVDIVLEIRDARIPLSSANRELEMLAGQKPRILILNKADLADPAATQGWLEYLEEDAFAVVAFNCLKPGKGIKKVTKVCKNAASETMEKLRKKGLRPRPVRAMVVGIPNTGKSSFINAMVKKGTAKTGNQPGVTRGTQWIRILKELELMDTPGILYPRFETEETGEKLAFCGNVSERVFDVEEAGRILAALLARNYPGCLQKTYGNLNLENEFNLLEQIGRNLSYGKKEGEIMLERTALRLLHDFQAGRIGRITLDKLEEMGE